MNMSVRPSPRRELGRTLTPRAWPSRLKLRVRLELISLSIECGKHGDDFSK